jgi:hypothetical protein
MDRTDRAPLRTARPTSSAEALRITVEHRYEHARCVPVRRLEPIDWDEPGISEDLSTT